MKVDYFYSRIMLNLLDNVDVVNAHLLVQRTPDIFAKKSKDFQNAA